MNDRELRDIEERCEKDRKEANKLIPSARDKFTPTHLIDRENLLATLREKDAKIAIQSKTLIKAFDVEEEQDAEIDQLTARIAELERALETMVKSIRGANKQNESAIDMLCRLEPQKGKRKMVSMHMRAVRTHVRRALEAAAETRGEG